MLLVADQVDDTQGGVIGDESTDDPTHRIALGGSLIAKSVTIDGMVISLAGAPMSVSVPRRITLPVKVKVFDLAGFHPTEITLEIRRIRERYAQVGIYPNIGEPDTIAYPPDYGDSPTTLGSEVHTSTRPIIKKYGTPGTKKDFHVFYCDQTFALEEDGVVRLVQGFAITDNITNVDDTNYANNFFVSKSRHPFTAAHELGHVLTDNAHYGTDYPTPKPDQEMIVRNLMRDGTSTADTIGASKRLYIEQQLGIDHFLINLSKLKVNRR
jgi:hypothetical protein